MRHLLMTYLRKSADALPVCVSLADALLAVGKKRASPLDAALGLLRSSPRSVDPFGAANHSKERLPFGPMFNRDQGSPGVMR
jgi:hypothetical protein